MFDTLSDKLQATLGGLGRSGRLDEEAVSKAMREIRLALLEADVNFEVAKEFTAAVKERALAQDVLRSLTRGQQVVKIVHEELTTLMGSGACCTPESSPRSSSRASASGPSRSSPEPGTLMVEWEGTRHTGRVPFRVRCQKRRPAEMRKVRGS